MKGDTIGGFMRRDIVDCFRTRPRLRLTKETQEQNEKEQRRLGNRQVIDRDCHLEEDLEAPPPPAKENRET